MKVRALAWNTFATLMRNKLILLFLAGFLCVVLLMMTPMLALRSYKGSPETAAVMVMGTVSVIMAMLTGFGSLLAAWSATAVVAAELNSGTILAVMARPIRRWEYLLGKYLGVQMLMWIYIVFILAMTYLLSWLGGARVQAGMWVLIVYPMVRYALYSALAMALAAILHPILAFGGVLLASVLAGMAGPGSSHHTFPEWLR